MNNQDLDPAWHSKMVMVSLYGMKERLVPIDKAGRVVLPKRVRDELALSPGDRLRVSIQGNEVTLTPKKVSAGLVRKGRALVFSSGADERLTLETVNATLTEERGARDARAAHGLGRRKRNP